MLLLSFTISLELVVAQERISYLKFKAISKISNDKLVRGLPKMKFVKDKLCLACEKGKQTKSSVKPK